MTKRVLWTVIFVLVFFSVYMIAPVSAQTKTNPEGRIKCEMSLNADRAIIYVTKRNGTLYVEDEFEVFHMEHMEADNGEPMIVLFFRNEKVFKNNPDRFFGLAMQKNGQSVIFVYDVNIGVVGGFMATGTCFEG